MTTRHRNATAVEVAALAGVSVATVSRALRGLPNVSEATRSRVLHAATELRYRAHPHASRLASGKTHTVGIAVPMIGRWYFAKVLAGVEQVLAPAAYDLLIISASTTEDRRRLVDDAPSMRSRIDGLIIAGVQVSPEEVQRWIESGLHVVSVGQAIEGLASISIDDAGAAALAVRHLVNLGHRRIGFIGACAPEGVQGPLADRRRGYAAELRRRRMRLRRELQVEAELTVAGGRDAMDRLMSLASPPTAVFAITDEMAVGAIDSVRGHGFEVPRHISVIGFDDHDLAAGFGLTTIRQFAVRHGQIAAGMLLAGLSGEPSSDLHVRDVTQLVVRSTTRPLRNA